MTDQSKADPLLPCPFCGGTSVMTQKGQDQLTIKCESCAVARTQKVLLYSIEWLQDHMISHWNTRTHASSEADPQRKALEKLTMTNNSALQNTDGAGAIAVLAAVRHCASSWEGEARLLGNVRASDIVRACNEALPALLPKGPVHRTPEDGPSIDYPSRETNTSVAAALMALLAILDSLDQYQKLPERGDWGVECICCRGEMFNKTDRAAIETARVMVADLALPQPATVDRAAVIDECAEASEKIAKSFRLSYGADTTQSAAINLVISAIRTLVDSGKVGTERAALDRAEAAFEFIRLKLIGNLEGPERLAFWRAVEARDAIRAITTEKAPT